MREMKTEILRVRVTPSMRAALDSVAGRFAVTTSEIARVALVYGMLKLNGDYASGEGGIAQLGECVGVAGTTGQEAAHE